MADEVQALTKAFSGLGAGLGVDESTMVSALGNWRKQPEKRSVFRQSFVPGVFSNHAGSGVAMVNDEYLLRLAAEFSRFNNIMVLWAMHPWERDARLAHHVLHEAHPAAVLVEVACARSPEELLGARKAYQALFHRSLEEDVAYHAMDEPYCNLLVGLVTAYRYQGPNVNDDTARAEAKALGAAVKKKKLVVEDGEVVRILTTRSKPHLMETFRHYKEIHGKGIEEDLAGEHEQILKETVQCLVTPERYFSRVMEAALRDGADHHGKEALARVAVTRSDVDMDAIRAAYHEEFGTKLEDAIAANAHGLFKDALVSLVAAT